MTPNDPLYVQQWHFGLIGDIETIWDAVTGQGVHVGVFDDGIEATHPDLAANYDAALHFTHDGTVYTPTPLSPRDGHGTATAGLIGAVAGNGVGGAGVAFGVTLTAVNVFDPATYATQSIELASIRWAAQFDIMSNSWGWTPKFGRIQDIGDAGSNHADYELAYQHNVETGRGGLGTIIVQAAGNSGVNANGDGLNASRFTITVAATDQAGDAQYYTNYGACILVTAPAASVTTDLSGNAGYNGTSDADTLPRDYTAGFGGTSAATPTVAGVVALMLQANADLGWRDVQNILAFSASETGSGYGNPQTGDEVGGWDIGSTTDWNGGGHAFHASYGYGMVDAFAAVRMAEAWLTLHGAAGTSATEQTTQIAYAGGPVAIPDFAPGAPGVAQASVVMTQDMDIETIYLTVDMIHSDARNLVLTLITPDDTKVAVLAQEGRGRLMDGGFEFTFGIDALRGYSAQGTWTLRIEDRAGGDVGTLNGFDLQFFGAAAAVNDVHTLTDDFLTLAAVDAGRRVLTDAQGDADWLNMAAVSGDITAYIAAGGGVWVDGVQWFTLATAEAQFEHLYTGDGIDWITGNRAANQIWSARGDDVVKGAVGDDTLNGGQGDDRLTGGKGADVFVFDLNFGADSVRDLAAPRDRVMLDQALWGGGLSVAQVISSFAQVVSDGVAFDFGGGNVVTFASVPQVEAFQDVLILI